MNKLYILRLEKEYRFWMAGETVTTSEPILNRRTIALKECSPLNRYWDEKSTPREEAYGKDVEVFSRALPINQPELYRNLRAAAESGWDFSSRWLVKDENGILKLETICTTEILPIDLNCLMYNMERQLANWLKEEDSAAAAFYSERAVQRKSAIQKCFWNQEKGWFFDYSWKKQAQTDVWSLAGVYPLFIDFQEKEHRLVSPEQADRMMTNIKEKFLQAGGVVTSLHETGLQWDAPNGWAPLQWVTVQGLRNYGYFDLAKEIARRFVDTATNFYQQTGKMMEKYNVCDPGQPGGGGEYPCQDGFGWTNGVVRAFIKSFEFQTAHMPEEK